MSGPDLLCTFRDRVRGLIAIYCMEKYMATKIGAKGKVVQVLGAVVDVEFPPDQLPQIYNEVKTRIADSERELSLEVEQHLGNNWVRCVAMGPTDGLQRGVDAYD